MAFPIDPTSNDISPINTLLELPTRAALRRALASANITDERDDDDPEQFLGTLSQVELRQVAEQAR